MTSILVVGGAGYIGSHMVKLLLGRHFDVTVLDNLSSGHRDAVVGGCFVQADLEDKIALDNLFAENQFAAVMHFASCIEVGESVERPGKYYQNNVANTLSLLNTMVVHKVKHFIFSSTAAIFGQPEYTPIDENHPKKPINPYGKSKLMVEQMLEDFDHAHGLKSVCLRYFNAAGADPEGQLGERHNPETHLIPLVLQAASRRRKQIYIYGSDYETEDGTCVRDYIHISDLCDAHLLALAYLRENQQSNQFNLGNGNGFSVREVIDKTSQVTQKNFEVVDSERRQGDPAVLVADAKKASEVLGWQAKFNQLEKIIEHAWQWELNHNWPN